MSPEILGAQRSPPCAVAELRAQGYPVLAEDVPRLSAFVHHHISIDGHYSFHLPDLGGHPSSAAGPGRRQRRIGPGGVGA